MAVATLLLRGDTTGIMRALGRVQAKAHDVAAALKSEFDRASAGIERRQRVMARNVSAALQKVREAEAEAANATVAAEEKKRKAIAETSAARRAASQSVANDAKQSEDAASNAAAAGARRRISQARGEAQQRRRLLNFDYEYRNTRVSFNGMQAARGFASGTHTAIQDARRTRAQADRVLDLAVSNASPNASAADLARTRATAQQFAVQTGIPYADVAAALSLGQGRGSALEGPGALDAALGTIREANAEGIDPGQMLAARGRLGQAGLRGPALTQGLRYMMRAAATGSVEVDQIIGQGLPGITNLMTQRASQVHGTGPEADAARQTAALNAFRESIAVQEIAAGAGRNPGNISNTLAAFNSSLRNPHRQDLMLNNIRTAEAQSADPAQRRRFASLREQLFERDPTRRGHQMRLREGLAPLAVIAALTESTGGDANRAAQLLAGTGHGNAQSITAPQRGLIDLLGGADPTGQTRRARVLEMMAGGGVSDTQIAQHEGRVEHDSLAEMNSAEEQGRTALTNNTDALVRLSNAFADWSTRNPVLSQAGGAVAGGIGMQLIRNAGTGAISPAAAAGGGGGVMAALAAPVGAGGAMARFGQAGMAMAAGYVGLKAGDWWAGQLRGAERELHGGGRRGDEDVSVFSGATWSEIASGLRELVGMRPSGAAAQPLTPQAVTQALSQATITVQVNPAAQAQAQAEGQRGRPANTSR